MSSIKDRLFQLVRPFFENQIRIAIILGTIAEQLERDKRNREIKIIDLQGYVGKPVIAISNEWEIPIIGFATRVDFITQAKDPVVWILNYLDGQEYLSMGSLFYYTQQRFDALFKLDPFEMCSFLYGRYLEEEFTKNKREELKGKEEVQTLLEAHGFYQRLAETKQATSVEL